MIPREEINILTKKRRFFTYPELFTRKREKGLRHDLLKLRPLRSRGNKFFFFFFFLGWSTLFFSLFGVGNIFYVGVVRGNNSGSAPPPSPGNKSSSFATESRAKVYTSFQVSVLIPSHTKRPSTNTHLYSFILFQGLYHK